MEGGVIRYSDEELTEFKAVIDKKLEQAREQLQLLQDQILEITENSGDEHGGDWMDDSSTNSEVEMLNNMAIRQRKYIGDLENALIRIKNKTYGICTITGELIDKRRLLAVPTTTKSLSAKNEARKLEEERLITGPTKTPYVKKREEKTSPKIITKVLRKPKADKPSAVPSLDDDDEDDDDIALTDELDLPVDVTEVALEVDEDDLNTDDYEYDNLRDDSPDDDEEDDEDDED